MGVLDIFDTRANFTGFIHNDYLRIGNIIQNAKIEVNEEGTIAVAVTGNYRHNFLNFFKYIDACGLSLIFVQLQNS